MSTRELVIERWQRLRDNWRPALRLHLPRLAPLALLFASLFFLRHEAIRAVGLSYDQALSSGVLRGYYFDFLVVLYPSLIAQLLWIAGAPKRVTWPIVGFLIWFGCMSNVLHYKFFGMRLDWWIIKFHWQDMFLVQGSARQIGFTWPIVLSALLVIGAVVLAATPKLLRQPASIPPTGRWRLQRLLWFAAILVLCVIVWRAPRFVSGRKATDFLSDNPVRVWIRQTTSNHVYAGVGRDWYTTFADGLTKDLSLPNRTLAAYQSFEQWNEAAAPELPGEPGSWPLYRDYETDPETTRALRARLGLPLDGPINVIMLFLESVRAYELYHPELGPQIYPSFLSFLNSHAIQFPQAYSSSFTAGQTVRGQFSTLCSMLPNITGAATYIAHNTTRVRCIQQLLKENGYQTAWMNTHKSMYHGKRAFEVLHGTDLFFEQDDFKARGVTEKLGYWGLADEPFLVDVVKLVSELAASGKPVFANVLTISVHHPYSMVAPLSESLVEETGDRSYYRKYLSRLRYEDKALTSFFEALFMSPIGDNTLVVLTADHSSPIMPHYEISHLQTEEMRFRVPLAFVTHNLSTPERIDTQVHQVDVAPAIASIVGVSGRVTWVGRNPFAGHGTPWVYQRGDVTMYRTEEQGCYPKTQKGALLCWDVAGRDPMYDTTIEQVPENLELTDFFRRVVQANMHAIVLNLAQPAAP